MTLDEITLAEAAQQEKNKEFSKLLAWIVYNGAALVGVAVNNPKKFPQLEDAFPSLFERKAQQDWRVMKERLGNYAKAKNNN